MLVLVFCLLLLSDLWHAGWLKTYPPNFTNPFSMSLTNYKTLQEDEVASVAALMKRCLRLNPENRPSAQELLKDPFWEGVV